MIAVSDSSPLITLTKIGYLELLPILYGLITITPEVHSEVVSAGSNLAGASQVRVASWVRVTPAPSGLSTVRQRTGLGAGEVSAIVLAVELKADLILVDDMRARKAAQFEGLAVLGCVGILRDAFGQGLLGDLTLAYRRLLDSGAYVSRELLERILDSRGLPLL